MSSETWAARVQRGWVVRAVVAVAVAVMAFGGGVTWATGRLPFAAAPPSCWGVDLSSLFPHRATDSQGIRPYGGTTPGCRIMVGVDRGRKVDGESDVFYADLDVLDSNSGDGPWATHGLIGALNPLGPGLTGMAGDQDAWVELPRACFATGTYDDSPPYVVRLSYLPRASTPPLEDVVGGDGEAAARRQRLAMANAAVALANRAASSRGCKGTLPRPTLPAAAQVSSLHSPGRRCDLPASALPPKAGLEREYRATGRSVSVCTLESEVGDLDVITISGDLGLADAFTGLESTFGHGRLLAPHDGGYAGSRLAAVQLGCGAQQVTFVARDQDNGEGYDAARVLASYASAQGPQLGCGQRPVRVSG